jgi:hypothetical protein
VQPGGFAVVWIPGGVGISVSEFTRTVVAIAGVTAFAALLAIFLLWLDPPQEDPFTPDPPGMTD